MVRVTAGKGEVAWVSQGVGTAISWAISGYLSLAPPSAGSSAREPALPSQLPEPPLPPSASCSLGLAAAPVWPGTPPDGPVISGLQLAGRWGWQVGLGGSQAGSLLAGWPSRGLLWRGSPPPPRRALAGTLDGFRIPAGTRLSEGPGNAGRGVLEPACLSQGCLARPGP